MTVHIALFRGINVGGANKLPMAPLREMATQAGAVTVQTYIQSGNMVFASTAKVATGFKKNLGAEIKKHFGFEPVIYLTDLKSYRAILAKNPFDKICDDASKLHVMFAEQLSKPLLAEVEDRLSKSETIKTIGKAVYFHAPDGVGRSKAAERLAKGFPKGTMRNWRTCLKLEEMGCKLEKEYGTRRR